MHLAYDSERTEGDETATFLRHIGNTMKKLKITPIDDGLVEEGVEKDYRGVKLKIARANNPAFKRVFRQLTKPYKEDLSNIDESTSERIILEAYAETILKGWSNFVIEDKEVPFNKQNAYMLMRDDPDCYDFITKVAGDMESYMVQEQEQLEKK